MVIIFDFLAVLGIVAIAYVLYRKFVAPSPSKDRAKQIAYEQGFSDAVKYFGLKKLYEDDAFLKERMIQVFGEAGTLHRLLDALEPQDRSRTSERPRKG